MDDNKKRPLNIIVLICAVISLAVLLFSIIMLWINKVSEDRNREILETLKFLSDHKTDNLFIDENINYEEYMSSLADSDSRNADSSRLPEAFENLLSINSDFKGWISIDGTILDYPVMQKTGHPEYYLHTNFYGDYEKAGLPFIDFRCDISNQPRNTIIYGHNMKNGDMFATLTEYSSYDFYVTHPVITFDTIYEKSEYEIISVFRSRVFSDKDSGFCFYNFINPETDKELEEALTFFKEQSIYNTNKTFTADDIYLTLTTCEYTAENGRFVVVARKKQ